MTWRRSVASVMGLLEEREAVARVRVEALQVEADRILEELGEAEPTAGADGISAKEIAARFGLELVPAKIEGVRSRAKRLADRDWLAASPTGRFTPRASSSPAATG
jgi:hypothetical protein